MEPPPKPSSQSKRVEPQRRFQERLEKPLALRCVEPRPALQSRLGQISAPHLREPLSEIQQRKIKKRKSQYAKCGRAVPAEGDRPQRTRKTMVGGRKGSGGNAADGRTKKKGRLNDKRPKSREETPEEGSDSGSATAYPS